MRKPIQQPRMPRVSLARALSKLGYCSRSEARLLIEAGRVRLDGTVQRNPGWRVDPDGDRITVDGELAAAPARVYLVLNKPRGLVTTTADEQGRATVFSCLRNDDLPFIAPVGRLDKASEGLLLFTNDTRWAARILDPGSHLDKTYHVQVDCIPDEPLLRRLMHGVDAADGARLSAKYVGLLRQGTRNSWLEIVLDEGKNRQIRRLLSAHCVQVLRLVRVSIGPLQLGDLPKGGYRPLTAAEVAGLAPPASPGR